MNQQVLFTITGLSILLVGGAIFITVLSGAYVAQGEVLQQQDNRTLEDSTVTASVFELGDPAFNNLNHSCATNFANDAYMNAYFQFPQIPRDCSIFINEKYHSTLRDIAPDCVGECSYEPFARTLHLGQLDVRDDHSLRVCCNAICIRKTLRRQCV